MSRLGGFRKRSDKVASGPGPPVLPSVSRAPFLSIGCATDKGQDREHNEDSHFFLDSRLRKAHSYVPFGFFAVADGMGGHEGGETASELATQIVASHLLRETYLPFLNEHDDDRSPRPINEVLAAAVEAANQALSRRTPGGGTTLTAVLIMESTAIFAHVGDSRAYLIVEGKLRRITQDHSLVGRLVEVGAISEKQALTHPQRNIVYRSVGQGEDLRTDWYSVELAPHSQILLCTDGLWASVADSDILSIIRQAQDPQQACQHLVQLARAQGSVDDITALLIAWGDLENAD